MIKGVEMNNYDIDNHVKEEKQKCVHTFVDGNTIQTEYTPDLCDKVMEYGKQGFLIEGFSGRYNVCTDAMCKWLSKPDEYPEFNSAVKISISACIHYWQHELQFALEQGDYQAVQVIRSIISDMMKSTPKQLRENLFDTLHRKTAEELAEENDDNRLKSFMGAVTGNNIEV